MTSEANYLEGELHSTIRHEYVDGEVFAMAGAKVRHNQISGNVFRRIGNHLENNPCRPFSADMKVNVKRQYFYPDVLVDCTELDDEDSFTESPTLIVEVLSQSTRRTDKTLKHDAYLEIPTLREYIIIETDVADIEVFRHSDNWRSSHYFLGDDIHIESIKLTLSVEDIYDRVKNKDMIEWLEKKALDEANES